jgi:transglutaminase-like putative cysteine protease
MSIFSFVVNLAVMRNKRSTLLSLLVLIGIAGISILIFRFSGGLGYALEKTMNFIRPYYESFGGDPIDIKRQIVLLFIVIVVVYKMLISFTNNKYGYYIFNGLAFMIIGLGFINGFLSTKGDRYALVVFASSTIVFYFYHYYLGLNKQGKSEGFRPFIIVSIIAAIVIISLSQILFYLQPYPFKGEMVQSNEKGENGDSVSGLGAYQSIINGAGAIKDVFTFEGRELFQVKTENVKYLRGIVYEVYSENQWSQGFGVYNAVEIDDRDPIKAYGTFEKVTIKYKDFATPIIMVSSYFNDIDIKSEALTLDRNSMRDTCYIEEYSYISELRELEYSFEAVIIDKNSVPLKDELKETTIAMKSLEGTPYEMSEGYERIGALALEITEDIDNDYEKIEAIIDYLHVNYSYSISPAIGKNTDKIEYFLFESKEGFCQHFATAATLMIRSLNMPARYVIGYKVTAEPYTETVMENQDTSLLIEEGYRPVYDENAHTWVEVYISDYGWIGFEATPSDGRGSFEIVIAEKTDENVAEEVKARETSDDSFIITVGLILLIIIGLVLIILFAYKILKDKKAYKNRSNTYKVRVLHEVILDYFKAAHIPKLDYESPKEFALRIDAIGLIEFEGGFQKLIDFYEEIVYGDKEATPEVVNSYLQYLTQIKVALKGKMGRFLLMKEYFKEFTKT